jgi:glutamate carboxypeptidase
MHFDSASMTARLIEWANINTGSTNVAGLDRFRAILRREFESLGGTTSEIDLPPAESVDGAGRVIQTPVGKALSVVKRLDAPVRVFLCIHMDTVYAPNHPFQSCMNLDDRTLGGPGVADAKGGLVVMLAALGALEASPLAQRIGWEVLINPDEEIGSLSSAPLLAQAAARNRVGLLFEPATADGALIERRKGSGSFTVVVHGKSAHAGRDFAAGRNAIVAMARLATGLHDLNSDLNGVTINVGKVEGGGPTNVVPDLAIVRFNVRTTEPADEPKFMQRLTKLLGDVSKQDGIRAELHGRFTSPPKIPDARGRALMTLIERCGTEMGLRIQWKHSGGTCDGNKLAAAGLPNIDTLGPCGGDLHSPREYVLLDTLPERARLTALVLMKLANGEDI